MLNDDVAQDDGHGKPSEDTGSRVQLPIHTYKHLVVYFQIGGCS